MKRILVISDSHGGISAVNGLRGLIEENDYIFHLGDGESDMREIRGEYPDKVYQCAGNCDFFAPIPEEGIVEIEGLRILFCHGHKYRAKSTLDGLLAAAKEKDCDIVLYGHTHKALITEREGVMLINPGSLRRKVGEGGSYCYLVIHQGKATPVLVGESVF